MRGGRRVPDAFHLDSTKADAVIALADRSLRAKTIAWLDGGANSVVFDAGTTGGEALVEVFVYRLLEGTRSPRRCR